MRNRIAERRELLTEAERLELVEELKRRALAGDNGAAAVLLFSPNRAAAEPGRANETKEGTK